MRKYFATVFILFLVSVLLTGCANAPSTQTSKQATENDTAAYDMILEHAYDFKDPASIKVMGGSLSKERDALWCTLSAKNSYNATGIGYYFIIKGKSWTKLDDLPESEDKKSGIEYAKARGEFDTETVNSMLAAHWK